MRVVTNWVLALATLQAASFVSTRVYHIFVTLSNSFTQIKPLAQPVEEEGEQAKLVTLVAIAGANHR